MQAAQLREQVIRQFQKHLGQYQLKAATVRVYQKLTPEMVFDLLVEASPACSHAARNLLQRMSQMPWTIKAAPKENGYAPAPLHITIDVPVNSRLPAYHLNCRETPSGLQVSSITNDPISG